MQKTTYIILIFLLYGYQRLSAQTLERSISWPANIVKQYNPDPEQQDKNSIFYFNFSKCCNTSHIIQRNFYLLFHA